MAPPLFADLGKLGRAVFTKFYDYPLLKMDATKKLDGGIEVGAHGSANTQEDFAMRGSVNAKYKLDDYKLTLSETVTSDLVLTTEIGVTDQPVEGAGAKLTVKYVVDSGDVDGKFHGCFGQDAFSVSTDFPLDPNGPEITLKAAYQHENFLVGLNTIFSTQDMNITSKRLVLGYLEPDAQECNVAINPDKDINGSYYKKVNDDICSGMRFIYHLNDGDLQVGVGAKCKLSEDTILGGKLHTTGFIGLSARQKITDGVNLMVSTSIDAKDIHNTSAHKVGACLQIEM